MQATKKLDINLNLLRQRHNSFATGFRGRGKKRNTLYSAVTIAVSSYHDSPADGPQKETTVPHAK